MEAVAEFMIRRSEKHKDKKNPDSSKAFERSAKEIKNLLNNGYTIEQATNFINNFENLGILEILKTHHSELKEYKDLKDVPKNIIENIVKSFLEKFEKHAGTNSKMDIGKSYQIFSSLMGRCTADEAQIFMNAFMTIASKDDKYKGLISSLKTLKDKPEVLSELLNDKNAFNDLLK